MHGGDWVAEVLKAQGVAFVFTLTGGHISPILTASKARGIRVIDTRHEVNAVFAADAVARLTGVPGVAVVTAGPGVTNTLTAVKNAQMAQSPVVLIGGAAATALKGRGALQDIEQIPLFKSVVKWSKAVKRVKEIVPSLEEAFRQAQDGVPGPVFVELPVDLLYGQEIVREWYGIKSSGGKSLSARVVQGYLKFHANRLFAGADGQQVSAKFAPAVPVPDPRKLHEAAARIAQAKCPLLLVGSQALLTVDGVDQVAAAVEKLGIPVYLSGMARGLLGRDHPLQMRHKRRNALKESDCVILAGVPVDFRLDYGNHIRRSATFISANRSKTDLTQNRRPDVAILGDPGLFLRGLAEAAPAMGDLTEWIAQLRARNHGRDAEIRTQMDAPSGPDRVSPLRLFAELDQHLGDNAILVADGGDFVGTASYILQPPGPLTWLDPGPFGTLGVGAGFALGAKLVRPDADVWIIYGDGSCGYSLAEFDTFARHGVAITALVGNDAGWSQIAREQVDLLGDDVATVLAHTDYDRVAAGFGGEGIRLADPELVDDALSAARRATGAGRPVLINAILAKSDFRKGSLSM